MRLYLSNSWNGEKDHLIGPVQSAEVLPSWPTVIVPEKHNVSNSALQGKADWVDDGYVVISEAVLTWMHLACSQWSNSQSWQFWGRSANDMWRRVHWRARIVLWAKSLRHHHRQRKGYINEVIQFRKWLSGVQQILVQCYITCLSCIFGVHRWKVLVRLT